MTTRVSLPPLSPERPLTRKAQILQQQRPEPKRTSSYLDLSFDAAAAFALLSSFTLIRLKMFFAMI